MPKKINNKTYRSEKISSPFSHRTSSAENVFTPNIFPNPYMEVTNFPKNYGASRILPDLVNSKKLD